MEQEIPLTQLANVVAGNAPHSSLIIDPSGNSITFYKYKGTLAEAQCHEITPESIRRKFKHAVTRGSTLALSIDSGTSLADIISPSVLPEAAFNLENLTEAVMEPFKDPPHEILVIENLFRLVFIVKTEEFPMELTQFIERGDLKLVKILS